MFTLEDLYNFRHFVCDPVTPCCYDYICRAASQCVAQNPELRWKQTLDVSFLTNDWMKSLFDLWTAATLFIIDLMLIGWSRGGVTVEKCWGYMPSVPEVILAYYTKELFYK